LLWDDSRSGNGSVELGWGQDDDVIGGYESADWIAAWLLMPASPIYPKKELQKNKPRNYEEKLRIESMGVFCDKFRQVRIGGAVVIGHRRRAGIAPGANTAK
jgi:hypothetical protein